MMIQLSIHNANGPTVIQIDDQTIGHASTSSGPLLTARTPQMKQVTLAVFLNDPKCSCGECFYFKNGAKGAYFEKHCPDNGPIEISYKAISIHYNDDQDGNY